MGLFIYQSLDAIDGKQARRTNSSTPLGELFDHGCDSLSTGECVTSVSSWGSAVLAALGKWPTVLKGLWFWLRLTIHFPIPRMSVTVHEA